MAAHTVRAWPRRIAPFGHPAGRVRAEAVPGRVWSAVREWPERTIRRETRLDDLLKMSGDRRAVRTSVSAARRARRSTSVWTMALLFIGGAVRCAVGAFVRTGPGAPSHLVEIVGVACLVVAFAVYVAGDWVVARTTPGLLTAVIALTTLSVATSPTRGDVMLNAFAYPWAGLYASHFLSRRAAYAFGILTSVGCAIGIAISGLPALLGAWVMVSATMAVVTVVTSSLVAALRSQSETDVLTGVANRAGFNRLAGLTLAAAARRCQPAALILCDVDGLKQVNDAQGHAAGDALLAGVAAAWAPLLRGSDVLGRIGGDEFALLMPDTGRAGAEAAVGRLQQATASAFSAGVAVWAIGDSIEDLLARADAAMYAHKETRRRSPVPLPRVPGLDAAVTEAGV